MNTVECGLGPRFRSDLKFKIAGSGKVVAIM